MIEIRFQSTRPRRLPFYLAMEEWVAHNLPADYYVFAWRVSPTVICGRNQDLFKEVNLVYCKENGIDVVRRRSGGGCVYADLNNYMFSFIAPCGDVEANYELYTSACASMLNSLGIAAEVSGRNDLLVDGAKIAGNAFYRLADRSIVHGTMLYDFNPERLGKAITPSKSKLESKAVKSVSSRVTSLKEHNICKTLEEFGRYAISYFSDGRYVELSEKDLEQIEKLEQRYYDEEFLYGKTVSQNVICRTMRVENVGELHAEISLTDTRKIKSVVLKGDYFSDCDLNKVLKNVLSDIEYNRDSIDVALSAIDSTLIRNLENKQLLDILI